MRNNELPPVFYVICGIVFAGIVFFGAKDIIVKDRIILATGIGTAFAVGFRLWGGRRRPSCMSVIALVGILTITIALLGGFK